MDSPRHTGTATRGKSAIAAASAADADGRFITAYNTTIFGGFEARYRTHDGSTGAVCAEVTESGYCWIDNHKCTIDEHRFGGIVIELFPSADDRNV